MEMYAKHLKTSWGQRRYGYMIGTHGKDARPKVCPDIAVALIKLHRIDYISRHHTTPCHWMAL